MNSKRIFLYLLIASVAASAILGVGIILLGEFGETQARILGTSMTITCMSLLGLACGANLESGKLPRFIPYLGIGSAVVSALIWLLIIWSGREGGEYVVKIVFTATILAVAVAYVSIVSLAILDDKFRWAQYIAYSLVVFLVSILYYTLWFDNDPDEGIFARLIGSSSVLIAAFTVIIPIFHKLSDSPDRLENLDREITKLRQRIDELEERKRVVNSAREETE